VLCLLMRPFAALWMGRLAETETLVSAGLEWQHKYPRVRPCMPKLLLLVARRLRYLRVHQSMAKPQLLLLLMELRERERGDFVLPIRSQFYFFLFF